MKFAIGERYNKGGAVEYEIIKRTSKTVTYSEIKHAGRYNETKCEPKTVKVHEWKQGEIFFTPNHGFNVAAWE